MELSVSTTSGLIWGLNADEPLTNCFLPGGSPRGKKPQVHSSAAAAAAAPAAAAAAAAAGAGAGAE